MYLILDAALARNSGRSPKIKEKQILHGGALYVPLCPSLFLVPSMINQSTDRITPSINQSTPAYKSTRMLMPATMISAAIRTMTIHSRYSPVEILAGCDLGLDSYAVFKH